LCKNFPRPWILDGTALLEDQGKVFNLSGSVEKGVKAIPRFEYTDHIKHAAAFSVVGDHHGR